MITTEEFKIKIPDDFTSEYIENELKKNGFDTLRWAITGFDNEYYTLSLVIVKD